MERPLTLVAIVILAFALTDTHWTLTQWVLHGSTLVLLVVFSVAYGVLWARRWDSHE